MKKITLICRDDRGTTHMDASFDQDSTWRAQAYMFCNFLRSQGFIIDPHDLGAEVSDYLDSEPEGLF